MVKIAPLRPYLPIKPEEFCTNPYDVIEAEEEAELKKNPNSLVHIILPDGEGEEVYQNAKKAFEAIKANGAITKVEKPSIFVYRQESAEFSQQGFIMGVSLQDYEDGNIVRHEHTREKPLADRTKHIATLNAATGLVWNVFKADAEIKAVMEEIKKLPPKFTFSMKNYRQILWQATDPVIIKKLQSLFASKKIYIADGHHRAASANEYRKMMLQQGQSPDTKDPWQYLMAYVASDDQIWILPYNRVVRKLPMSKEEFIAKLKEVFTVEAVAKAFNPAKQHEMAVCIKGEWYKLIVKDTHFTDPRDALDVAILQDRVKAFYSVAWIQCVGSRDSRAGCHAYCSRVCCLYAIKQARQYKEKHPEADVYIFYIDVRAFGKGYEEFYESASRDFQIKFIRGRVSEITENSADKSLNILAEDTLLGELLEITVDMVVLSIGLEARKGADKLGALLTIQRSADGFFLEAHPKLRPVDSLTDGIFIGGVAQGPKDIPDAVAQAKAAAASAASLMAQGEVEVNPYYSIVNPNLCSGCRSCIEQCPFGAISFDEVVGRAEINPIKCKGCGTCASTCPSQAISQNHFKREQLMAEIRAVLPNWD